MRELYQRHQQAKREISIAYTFILAARQVEHAIVVDVKLDENKIVIADA